MLGLEVEVRVRTIARVGGGVGLGMAWTLGWGVADLNVPSDPHVRFNVKRIDGHCEGRSEPAVAHKFNIHALPRFVHRQISHLHVRMGMNIWPRTYMCAWAWTYGHAPTCAHGHEHMAAA